VDKEPYIRVAIIDGRDRVRGRLRGEFTGSGRETLSGPFTAASTGSSVTIFDNAGRAMERGPEIVLSPSGEATFELEDVTIGVQFHWERSENQTFEGGLLLKARPKGTLAAINRIPLESYLTSVISSEMNASAPIEFLKAHAIMSRSWVLAAIETRKKRKDLRSNSRETTSTTKEVIRWYDREDHDLYDVCADDHCQRYQGVTKITTQSAQHAIDETRGLVLSFEGSICDARYSKACGGLTEEFGTAWGDVSVPYLRCISDSASNRAAITSEQQAREWILSSPDVYCNTRDSAVLGKILPGFDQETPDFFRWSVTYNRKELEDILREKSGYDFGDLHEIAPLRRGPSGRISRLRISGSKMSMELGKELEIRKWLSRSHLFSSAFVVEYGTIGDRGPEAFTFLGAGWGHGVGLCQIGAAVMADRGFSADEILSHYFPGAEIKKLYE
jgi:stage II sporulation protein D